MRNDKREMDQMKLDQLHYHSDLLRVGTFHCPAWHPHFQSAASPIGGYLLVFPRTSVRIEHVEKPPVVTDPNIVMLYNEGQIYRRGKLSERGDLCDWFAFRPSVIAEAIRPYDPAVVDRVQSPFVFTHGPADSPAYLLQRLVVNHLRQSSAPDRLYVEETMQSVLDRVIRGTYRAWGVEERPARRATARQHAELAQEVKALLATRYEEQLSLDDIAGAVHVSPYHLCRVFRQQTGRSVHHYLNQIRLRTSLEQVAERDTPLADIGLQLGYASHSHFTQAFRHAFGTPPSAVRQTASTSRLREMRKILKV